MSAQTTFDVRTAAGSSTSSKQFGKWAVLAVLLVVVMFGTLGFTPNAMAQHGVSKAGILRSWHRHGKTTYDIKVEVVTGTSPYSSYRRAFRLDSKTKYYWQNSDYSYSRVSAKTYWSRVKAKRGPFYRNIMVRAKKVGGRWRGSTVHGGFAAS